MTVEHHHPADAAEIAAIIADAAARAAPVEVLGYGSKRALGRPVAADTRVHLDRLDAVHLYEPDEMVLSVGAGTALSKIDTLLAQHRQRLAFAPPDWRRLLASDAPEQSIGGVVAANLSGSVRLTSGAARDHLIGFTAVNGRGERFKSGGRVVKNVTGYDLSKLMAGSFGTLAVLDTVILRALPMPETETTLAVRGIEAQAATHLFSAALAGPFDVTAAAWLPATLSSNVGLDGTLGLLRFEGLEASVRERAQALARAHRLTYEPIAGTASSALWQALGNGAPFEHLALQALWRVSVPPMSGAGLLSELPQSQAWLDWAGGLVWLAVPDEADAAAARIRAYVAHTGGHATLLRASPETRARVPVFEPLAPALAALSARLRASFDPAGILNPGKMS